jgi:hypothetical protein
MALIVDSNFNMDLDGLGAHLKCVLRRREAYSLSGRKTLRLIGPIAVFSMNASDVVRGRTRSGLQIGWRGLVVDDEGAPIACVDINNGLSGTNIDEKVVALDATMPEYTVNGPAMTKVLYDALLMAEESTRPLKRPYRARLIKIEATFVTSLWLQGRDTKIIVVRDGIGNPPPLTVCSREEFITLIRSRRRIPSACFMPRTDEYHGEEWKANRNSTI